MVMGAVCTRACRFCSVDTGNPHGWLDSEEPQNVARTVDLMKLKYVVLTSVNRDDLPDGAARWEPAVGHVPLAFDHDAIVTAAVERVRGKLWWSNVAVGVLEPAFTLAQARCAYEAIAGAG